MTAAGSSPEYLRELWERYADRYSSTLRGKPSKRNLCLQLGWDGNALSKWMTLDAPNHRRIPLDRIEVLAIAMRLTQAESDRLMGVRIREVQAADANVRAAVAWAIEASRRAAKRRYQPTDEEERLLAAFRLAREAFPRGLYGDAEEPALMLAQMQVLLERAEGLHSEEASTQDGKRFKATARQQRALDGIKEHLRMQASFGFKDARKAAARLQKEKKG